MPPGTEVSMGPSEEIKVNYVEPSKYYIVDELD
jgi:hypothetical protein